MKLTPKLINKILDQGYTLQVFLPEVTGVIIDSVNDNWIVKRSDGTESTLPIPEYSVCFEHINQKFIVREFGWNKIKG